MSTAGTEGHWDYVIVGAGSAGCVLARRLSEDPDARVLLLEAGGHAPTWDWRIHMPAAFAYPMNSRTYNWNYASLPQAGLGGRVMPTPRGRVLGGSSSINGMAYVRGHALDYERWARDPELSHWTYGDCLPYFRRAETHDLGGDAYHGGDGPLHVTTGRGWSPLYRAFVEAGTEAGYPYTADMNGYCQEGFGPMQMTVRDGVRCSAYEAYVEPVRDRPNLEVHTRAQVTRVCFDGRRAVGVEYRKDGCSVAVHAERRIILAAGAIGSPQMLMLSGIGPAGHLREHGIDVLADLSGVGANLQDHLEVYIQHRCQRAVSLYPALRPHSRIRVGIQWWLLHTGHGATNHFEAGGFIRSAAGVRHPDLQYHFAPLAVDTQARPAIRGHSFQVQVGTMRPQSRGSVRLRSADPRRHPAIDPRYLDDPDDRLALRAGIRLTREILGQPALAPYAGTELAPGWEVTSDRDLDEFIMRTAHTAFHPSCTCAMGSHAEAVVDGNTAVHGVEGLNVVDASVFPTIVSGNLNAPTIMVAEKAADLIAGREPLPREEVDTWIHPEWERQQR